MTDRTGNSRARNASGSDRAVALFGVARFGRALALVAAFSASAGAQAFEVNFKVKPGDGKDTGETSDVVFDFDRHLSSNNTLSDGGRSVSPTYGAALGAASRANAQGQAGLYARTSVVALPGNRIGNGSPGSASAASDPRAGSQCWHKTSNGLVRLCAAAFGPGVSGLHGLRVAGSALLIEQAPRFALASFSALGDRKVGPNGSTPANALPQRIAMGMFMDKNTIAEVREPGTLGLVALVLIALYGAHRHGLLGGVVRRATVKA